jgi:hypothetical protein
MIKINSNKDICYVLLIKHLIDSLQITNYTYSTFSADENFLIQSIPNLIIDQIYQCLFDQINC